MTEQRLLRDCPRCGAHKGFACNAAVPDCPQHEQVADAAAEVDMLPAGFPFGVNPEDIS